MISRSPALICLATDLGVNHGGTGHVMQRGDPPQDLFDRGFHEVRVFTNPAFFGRVLAQYLEAAEMPCVSFVTSHHEQEAELKDIACA